jgi:hypothetical protein
MRLNEMRTNDSTTQTRAGAVMMACGLAIGVAGLAAMSGCSSMQAGRTLADGRFVERLSNVEGAACYHSSEAAAKDALPSMAMQRPRTPARGSAATSESPAFSVENERQTAKIRVGAGTSLYGTGEVGGPLLRNGRRVECWNTDAYGYSGDSASLYKSHPWVLGVRADGTAFGVLADTTYRCEIDLTSVNDNGGEIVFRAVGPSFPVIVIERNSPQEVVAALASDGADRDAAEVGHRVSPVPVLVRAGHAGDGDRQWVPLAGYSVRRDLARHRLHEQVHVLHVR